MVIYVLSVLNLLIKKISDNYTNKKSDTLVLIKKLLKGACRLPTLLKGRRTSYEGRTKIIIDFCVSSVAKVERRCINHKFQNLYQNSEAIYSNMGHGGYSGRGAASQRKKPVLQGHTKDLNIDKKTKRSKPKSVSMKNQIRSVERILRKDLPPSVKDVQYQKLEQLKKQQQIHINLALESKGFLRDKKIRFFERRKIERSLRRMEKQQLASTGDTQDSELSEQLSKLKEDLEYVKFFPKTERYVSLFMGGDAEEIEEKRNRLRKKVKDNLVAVAASGKDLEETGSGDDGLLDLNEDDFFLNRSSSEDADADYEWSARDQISCASVKAASGMSSDDKNQRRLCALAVMPPPAPLRPLQNAAKNVATSSKISGSTGMKHQVWSITGNSGNLSSNSDARKPRRKRRPKKKMALVQ